MAAVSLPSIHEMFPAHLMRRDHFSATSNQVLRPRPSTSSPALPSPTCSIAGCHCSSASSSTLPSPTVSSSSTKVSPHARVAYPHPVTHSVAQHVSAFKSTYRPFSSDGRHRPVPSANASRRSIFSGAHSHLQVHLPRANASAGAYAETPAPGPSSGGAPPRACPSSSSSSAHHAQDPEERSPHFSAHPYPYPNSRHERDRRPSYAPPPPPHHRPPHPHERLQHATDTANGDEDDASEGSIGGSPMPSESNLSSSTLQMQMRAHQGVLPPHLVPAHPIPTYTPGMSVIPLCTPVFEEAAAASGKKHVCPTCFKRFNRPSSLRIHFNTHTGATPFRCPYPNCGREFSVNSNMRRHYRNHTSGSTSTASTASSSSSSSSTSNPNPDPTNHPRPMTNHPAIPPAPRGSPDGRSPRSSARHLPTSRRKTLDGDRTKHKRARTDPENESRGPSWNARNPSQDGAEDGDEEMDENEEVHEDEEMDELERSDPENEYIDELQRTSRNVRVRGTIDHGPTPTRALSYANRIRARAQVNSSSESYSHSTARTADNGNADSLDPPVVSTSRSQAPRPRALVHTVNPSPSTSPSSSLSSSPALSAFGGHSSRSSQSSQSSVFSSSPSVSPSETKPLYSPSSPYSLSVADARVATVLRPAFGQVEVGPGSARR